MHGDNFVIFSKLDYHELFKPLFNHTFLGWVHYTRVQNMNSTKIQTANISKAVQETLTSGILVNVAIKRNKIGLRAGRDSSFSTLQTLGHLFSFLTNETV